MTTFNPISKIWSGAGKSLEYKETDSLGKKILAMLKKHQDKIVQISDNNGVSVTGRDLSEQSIRVAENLRKIGFKQDDVISIISRNNHQLAPVNIGCFLIGAPINTLDPVFEKNDIFHMLKLTKPKAVICEADKVPVMRETLEELHLQSPIFVFGDSKINGTRSVDELFVATGTENSYQVPELGPASETIACIICSSGTTGLSKGVILTHAQFLVKLVHIWEPHPDDIVFTFSSLYWLSGFGIMTLGLLNGCCRIITTEPQTPKLLFNLVKTYKITKFFAPPSLVGAMLHAPGIETADLSSVQILLCGGSMVSTHLRTSISKYLKNGIVVVGYGMTEVCGVISREEKNISKSVGILRAETEVKIVDVDDTSRHYGVNEDGEICFRTLPKFLGYYGDEESTKLIRDGDWLRSGDIGHFDETGNLFIVDRKKDILKCKNYQISPSEIEEFISKIPGVEMVSVVGVPDKMLADLVTAVVVKKQNSAITADEIIQKVENGMPDYKRLRGGVFFVDKLPLTPSGKVIKIKVREHAIELYNSVVSA